jgi:hypothetical protein
MSQKHPGRDRDRAAKNRRLKEQAEKKAKKARRVQVREAREGGK